MFMLLFQMLMRFEGIFMDFLFAMGAVMLLVLLDLFDKS
jgi:hypothetical protein